MSENAITVIVAVLSSGALTAIISYLSSRSSARVDAAASNTDTALKLRDEVIEENASLHEQVAELQKRVAALETRLEEKSRQWGESRVIIAHQSQRIAELTTQLNHAETTIAKLQHDLAIEKGRVTRLRNRITEMGGKPDTGELPPLE